MFGDDLFAKIYMFFLVKFFATKLPVKWGNYYWYEYENFIFQYGKIRKKSKDWIDYSNLPEEETSGLLKKVDESGHLRQKLNEQIIEIILNGTESPKQRSPICIFTSGGTASGKTSAVDLLNSEDPILRIDYDRIKKLLPEYLELLSLKHIGAAKYVQSESVKIGGKLFKRAFKRKVDLIYEKTLDDQVRTKQDIKELRKKKYEIIVVATHLTKENGLVRAEKRYQETGRFVPPDIISKIYAGVPACLFEIRNKVDEVWLFDNNGPRLELMFQKGPEGIKIVNPNLYAEYLNYVGKSLDLSL